MHIQPFSHTQHSARRSSPRGLYAVIIGLAVALIMAGCSNPLGTSGSGSGDGTGGADEGSLEVRLDAGSLSTQTLAPDLNDAVDSIDHYDVTLSRDGYSSLTQDDVDAQESSVSFSGIPTGTWNVDVKAYNGAGDNIAAGNSDIDVGGGDNSATVDLEFLTGEGTGDVAITIDYPGDEGISSVSATLRDEDGNEETLDLSVDTDAGTASWNATKEAGSYDFVAELKQSDGTTVARVVEAVNVFGNLESQGTISLTSDQISSAPAAPSSVSAEEYGIGVLRVTWEDSGPIETGYTLERSADGGSTWTTVDDAVAANTLAHDDEGLTVGEDYRYRVRAENDFGTSDWTEMESDEEVPQIVHDDGPYDIQQDSQITLDIADKLLSNDTSNADITFESVKSESETGVDVTDGDSDLTVESTGLANEGAEFTYEASDPHGNTAEGTVTFNVTPLPEIEGYVYSDSGKFDDQKNEYEPPTQKDIFEKWGRFDSSDYWADHEDASGTAADWKLIADEDGDDDIDDYHEGHDDGRSYFDEEQGNVSEETRIYGDIDSSGSIDQRVMQPSNGSFNGFASPDEYDNYTLEVTLWSADPSDDDMLGVALAVEDSNGSLDGVLWVGRTRGGVDPSSGWGLVSGSGDVIADFEFDDSVDQTNWATGDGDPDTDHRDDLASRVKVVRDGDTITVRASDWHQGVSNFDPSSFSYNDDSKIVIDLSSTTDNIEANGKTYSKDLTQFQGGSRYGYVNDSQAMSTFLDVQMSGGIEADTLVQLTPEDTSSPSDGDTWSGSEVWTYDYTNAEWVEQTDTSIQEEFDYVRHVTNPETGNRYRIDENEVVYDPPE